MYVIYLWNDSSNKPNWIADWDGDPGRTLLFENAKRFKTEKSAKNKLSVLKKQCPFRDFSLSKVCKA
jgi:hypothetical protein